MHITWRPQIGDPTVLGWATVVAYFATVGLAMWARGRASDFPKDRTWWGLVALSFFFLGINKQLDLQSLLTDIGRQLARQQGWYEDRTQVQLIFILGMIGVGSTLCLSLFIYLRRSILRIFISLLGFLLTVLFVIARASSFHKMDRFISFELVFGLQMNWIMELGGIGLVFLGAVIYGATQGARRTASSDLEPSSPL